jgi:hypothetical protein
MEVNFMKKGREADIAKASRVVKVKTGDYGRTR